MSHLIATVELASRRTLPPEAVLYVKCPAWSSALGNGSAAGTCRARSSAPVAFWILFVDRLGWVRACASPNPL